MNATAKIQVFFQLGFRNALRRGRRSFLVITAGGTGMFGVIVSMTFMRGFSQSMTRNGVESTLGHAQIRPETYNATRKTGLVIKNGSALRRALDELETHPEANFSYAPRLEREGVLRLGTFQRGVMIIGMDFEREKKVSSFHKWITAGKPPLKLSGTRAREGAPGIPGALIGRANALKMDAGPGDWAVISFTDKNGENRSARVHIRGVFRSPTDTLDKYAVLLDRAALSRLYAGSDRVYGSFVFRGKELSQARTIANFLRDRLSGKNGLPSASSYEILTYDELEPAIPRLIRLSDQFLMIAIVIIMLGFALLLFDTISMSVAERTREIGVIRALGARPAFAFWMTTAESVSLTMLGCLGGFLIASGLTWYFNKNGLSLAVFAEGMELLAGGAGVIHPYLTLKDALASFAAGLLTSLGASIPPAWKAAALNPVEAIHYR